MDVIESEGTSQVIVHGDHYFCSGRQLGYPYTPTQATVQDFAGGSLKSEKLPVERLGQWTQANAKALLLLLENGKRCTARSWARRSALG